MQLADREAKAQRKDDQGLQIKGPCLQNRLAHPRGDPENLRLYRPRLFRLEQTQTSADLQERWMAQGDRHDQTMRVDQALGTMPVGLCHLRR